jgi:GMP synthase-like glutamine amidotransferase
MRPVAIFRHLAIEGPGHFATFLERHTIPWRLIAIDQGMAVPDSATEFAGLAFMGGPMSVNDNLPWIGQEIALIQQAVAADIPVLGHCLGAQLMAKALGADVTRNPVKEIGWGKVTVLSHPAAQAWFGAISDFTAFHWHGETFALPEDADRLLASPHCPNQAFSLGKHLALQCHVEMTPDMIRAWCDAGADEIASADSPAVQPAAEILGSVDAHLGTMQGVADQLYAKWIQGLRL